MNRLEPPSEMLSARYRIKVNAGAGLDENRAIAIDEVTGQRVFLKWSADAAAIDREADILNAVKHPNIVELRHKDMTPEGGLLVLDLVEGVNLAAWLKSAQSDHSPPSLTSLFSTLAEAVAAIHAAGFIHRDLKPANIIVRSDGSPVVVDFDAAARMGRDQERQSLLTQGYAAPEQYRTDQPEGPWTDVYGLAALGYRAILGEPPPPAPDRERDDVPSVLDENTNPDLERLARAVDRGLTLDASKRPQTAEEWLSLFKHHGGQALDAVPAETSPDDYPPTIRVSRRQSDSYRSKPRKPVGAAIAANGKASSSGGWRFVWLVSVIALLGFGAFWFGRPLYERYVKSEWIVDIAGGGDAVSIADALGRARPGAVISVRSGVYRDSLILDHPVKLVAAEADAPPELIVTEAPCLQTRSDGSSISGFNLRKVASTESTSNSHTLAESTACLLVTGGNLEIKASQITNEVGPAVSLGGGSGATIRDSNISATGGAAIVIGGDATAKILNNRIMSEDAPSLLVRSGAVPEIDGNIITGGEGVLYVEGASGRFSNNQIKDSARSGLRVAHGSKPEVIDNSFEESGEAGLFVYEGGGGRFEGNRINASALSGAVIGDASRVELSGNMIEANGEHGILLLDGSGASLVDNVIADNAGHGIALSWYADITLQDNELRGNQEPELFDARPPNEPRQSLVPSDSKESLLDRPAERPEEGSTWSEP
ncbi:MAG: right-handed parallel beta-helix repeat-containing protein [Geminicoccaceae bacterium]